MYTRILLLLWMLLWACSARGQGTYVSVDIGSRTPVGTTVAADNGFNVSSSTGDIWGSGDDCRFVYQSVSGDFDFQARVASLAGPAYWAKAGLMLRSGLTDSAASHAVTASPASGFGRFLFLSRFADFSSTFAYFTSSLTEGRVRYPNTWTRLVRIGDQLIPQHGTNGIDWIQLGVYDLYQFPRIALLGLTVATHTDAVGQKTTAQFRDLALARGGPVAPVIVLQPQSVIVNPGDDVTLEVSALGEGSLEYQWFRDGEPIAGAVEAVLHRLNLTDETAGKFTCQVSNSAGRLMSWAAQVEVAAPLEPWDGIYAERFLRAHGRLVEYLVNQTNYSGAPASRSYRANFESPSHSTENMGDRLRGWVLAPQTGNYTFWVAGDDFGELWVSSDENPANRRRVAECPYYVGVREWNAYQSQKSAPMRLEAGRRYYVEAIFKGDGAPNHGAIGWTLPDGALERPIPGARFRGAVPQIRSFLDAPWLVEGTPASPYVLEQSFDLVSWSALSTNRSPFRIEWLPTIPGSVRFLRATSER